LTYDYLNYCLSINLWNISIEWNDFIRDKFWTKGNYFHNKEGVKHPNIPKGPIDIVWGFYNYAERLLSKDRYVVKLHFISLFSTTSHSLKNTHRPQLSFTLQWSLSFSQPEFNIHCWPILLLDFQQTNQKGQLIPPS